MNTLTSNHSLTKEHVRAWLIRRHVSREPLPDRELMLRQLGCAAAGTPDAVPAASTHAPAPFISRLSQEICNDQS